VFEQAPMQALDLDNWGFGLAGREGLAAHEAQALQVRKFL